MSDLISRQAAVYALDAMCKNYKEYIDYDGGEGFVDAIKELPSAQTEIIRCRDCEHYYYADNRIPQEQRYVCDINGEKWKPDDFCSYAERRTDE